VCHQINVCVCVQEWRHIDVSTKVTDEDIFGVIAKKVSLLSPEPEKDHDSSTAPARSFSIGVWKPSNGKVSAGPVKSIHHFCILPDGLQLPTPYRGVWQHHHRQMSSPVSDSVR